jgi:transposase-like protein
MTIAQPGTIFYRASPVFRGESKSTYTRIIVDGTYNLLSAIEKVGESGRKHLRNGLDQRRVRHHQRERGYARAPSATAIAHLQYPETRNQRHGG